MWASVARKDVFHDIRQYYVLTGEPLDSPSVYVNGLLYEEGPDYEILRIGNPAKVYIRFINVLTLPITIQVHYGSKT